MAAILPILGLVLVVAFVGWLVYDSLFRGSGGNSGASKESLNVFTRTQKYPDGTSMEVQPMPSQTPEERKNTVRFMDQVYVREYGGPFGSGKEYMTAIKSSPGFSHRKPPPKISKSTQLYDNYEGFPNRHGILYRGVGGQMCSSEPMERYMSMVVDSCDGVCTEDNGCIAYAYDFRNAQCFTFGECDSMKPASSMIKTFVKSIV